MGWLPAGEVKRGYRLLSFRSAEGVSEAVVERIESLPNQSCVVETLTVGGPEQAFFAGGLLVHNKSFPDDGPYEDFEDEEVDRGDYPCTELPPFADTYPQAWSGWRSDRFDFESGFRVGVTLSLVDLVSGANYSGVSGVSVEGDPEFEPGEFESAEVDRTQVTVAGVVENGTQSVEIRFGLRCGEAPVQYLLVRLPEIPGGYSGGAGLTAEVFEDDPE